MFLRNLGESGDQRRNWRDLKGIEEGTWLEQRRNSERTEKELRRRTNFKKLKNLLGTGTRNCGKAKKPTRNWGKKSLPIGTFYSSFCVLQ